GTYTLTWRVISADGHPVHGGFSFYVGAPSTISAKAVKQDVGAGRVVGWGFGVVRFAWFAALLGLIGAAVTRRWVWTLAVAVVGLVRRRRLWGVAPRVWLVLLAASAAGLCFVAALNGHARTLGHPALGVASVAAHLAAVGVWVGGLGALVVLGGLSWRTLPS